MQFGTVMSVDYGTAEAVAVGACDTGEQNTCRCRNRLPEIICVCSEGEVEHGGIDHTDCERSRRIRIHIHINSQMILELAEHVERAAGDAQREDGTTGFDKRAPGDVICAA